MQDSALLEVAYYLSSDSRYAAQCADWIALAKERLDAQRTHAYSVEMVHVENSIGYHEAVTVLFAEVVGFLEEMGDNDASARIDALDKAREFTAWATMPNGVRAAFGDTFRGETAQLPEASGQMADITYAEGVQTTQLYAESGYWFYRGQGVNGSADASWKMFKAGYSSGTHKHADDCSFMLYGKGTPIFIDPGMYNYMFGDPYREYMLSSSAHNTVTVDEKSYSPTEQNAWKTGILSCSTTDKLDYVLAFNDMYAGVEIDRHFYSSGDLTILFDDIVSDEVHTYSQLFHLCENVFVTEERAAETLIQIGESGWRVRIRQFVPVEQACFQGRENSIPLYGHAGGKINQVVACETLRYQQHAQSGTFVTVITLEDPDGLVLLKNGERVHYTEISVEDDLSGFRFGEETVRFMARTRFYARSEADVKGTSLRISFPQNPELCQYTVYLLRAQTGESVYKREYTQETSIELDLAEFAGEDLLIKTYARANDYPQKKQAVTAALLWDAQRERYSVDDGSVYPYLNLEYLGHRMEKTGDKSYLFTIDYRYSLPSTQRWFIYRNGGYYFDRVTENQSTFAWDFTEPGDYAIMYYLRTKNGNNEFWRFEQIHIEE